MCMCCIWLLKICNMYMSSEWYKFMVYDWVIGVLPGVWTIFESLEVWMMYEYMFVISVYEYGCLWHPIYGCGCCVFHHVRTYGYKLNTTVNNVKTRSSNTYLDTYSDFSIIFFNLIFVFILFYDYLCDCFA